MSLIADLGRITMVWSDLVAAVLCSVMAKGLNALSR